ncbi:MAG: hypothetical protein AAFQ96_08340, partial [Pseudomonadota bacterium]
RYGAPLSGVLLRSSSAFRVRAFPADCQRARRKIRRRLVRADGGDTDDRGDVFPPSTAHQRILQRGAGR